MPQVSLRFALLLVLNIPPMFRDFPLHWGYVEGEMLGTLHQNGCANGPIGSAFRSRVWLHAEVITTTRSGKAVVFS